MTLSLMQCHGMIVLSWVVVVVLLLHCHFEECDSLSATHHPLHKKSDIAAKLHLAQQLLAANDDDALRNNHNTAVVLNTNARSVSNDLIPIAQEIFGKDYVYVTTTAEEAQECATKMIQQQNVSLVVPVGGDGTVSSMMNYLCHAVIDKNNNKKQSNNNNNNNTTTMSLEQAMSQLPHVGYIPLGTGNGLGSVVGFPVKFGLRKKYKLTQVRTALEAFRQFGRDLSSDISTVTKTTTTTTTTTKTTTDIIELPMMELSYSHADKQKQQQQQLCFFTGVGFDSLMLQDFYTIKKFAQRSKYLPKLVRNWLSSVAGYTIALLLKTLPKCVLKGEHNIQLEITSTTTNNNNNTASSSSPTLWVDHRRGDLVRTVTDQQQNTNNNNSNKNKNKNQLLLYKGTAGIVAASTTPYYGGKLRLFPFARITQNGMHLRIGRIHPLRGFFNIPRIFSGTYRDFSDRNFGCLDFIGQEFQILVTAPTRGFPLQHSGESVGIIHQCQLKVLHKSPVKFVTFMSQRCIECDDA